MNKLPVRARWLAHMMLSDALEIRRHRIANGWLMAATVNTDITPGYRHGPSIAAHEAYVRMWYAARRAFDLVADVETVKTDEILRAR